MLRRIFIVFGALFVLLPTQLKAQEVINAFDVFAELKQDRRLIVTETITYNFGAEERHGIFRYIPERFRREGLNYNYRFRVISVKRDGLSEPFGVSRESGQLRLKIGDPDRTISGQHVYEITYETRRAVNFFPEHGELYWNVTGHERSTLIEDSKFTLRLPKEVKDSELRTACFTGQFASIEKSCETEITLPLVSFTATRALLPDEGFTVVIGFPPGLISAPTVLERILLILSDNFIILLPLLVFVLMGVIWSLKGKDPLLRTIIPIYESPQALAPALVSAIRGEGSLTEHGVTATILDLARRDYLHIRYGEEEKFFGKKQTFTFIRQRDPDSNMEAFETTLFRGMFGSKGETDLPALKAGHFYDDVKRASEHVWKEMKALRVFESRPALVRTAFIILAIGVTWLLFVFFAADLLGVVIAFVTGLIIAVFGWFMPRRTLHGVKLLSEIKGFEWFMSVTEKDRLKFHQAPERTPEEFYALLPYAVALGVEVAWAKQFEGLSLPQPEWAEGTGWSMTSSTAFVSSLDSFHSQASSSVYHAPSSAGSGGSGFSGGGVGGGGGGGSVGSW